METFLRVARPPAKALAPIEFELFRPYYDLGTGRIDPPAHVVAVELAWLALRLPPGQRPPVQYRPGSAFRRRITSVPGLTRYAGGSPADLAPRWRTRRWEELCDMVESFSMLAPAAQAAVTTLLSTLGYYELLADMEDGVALGEPDSLVTVLRVAGAHAALDHTVESQLRSARILQAIEESDDLPVRARLSAAISLVVLHARGALLSREQVTHYSRIAARHVRLLSPDDDWLDALSVSTFWRAVSFEPYLAKDVAATREQLDLAERYARSLPETTAVQRQLRMLNFHPLLETRSIEAAWAGDLDRAIGYATEMAERDPADGKAHIRLGDLRARKGEKQSALSAYLAATVLGAPYASLAWCKAAELGTDRSFEQLALAQAHQADPEALTPLLKTIELARRDGLGSLGAWATEKLELLQSAR
jgi:tetratricopeptide (TPR) repeat protein